MQSRAVLCAHTFVSPLAKPRETVERPSHRTSCSNQRQYLSSFYPSLPQERRVGIWKPWPPSKTGLRKVFFSFEQWLNMDDKTTAPNPGLKREVFSPLKAMKSKRQNQWSDQMMDPVISWFSEMSNNALPVRSKFSVLAPALNLPFYPFRVVPSSSGFILK